jgi:hypothetical protein
VLAGKGSIVEQSDIIRKRTVYARERQGRTGRRQEGGGRGTVVKCEMEKR